MKVKLIFDAQFCGKDEKIISIPDNTTETEIKALFPNHMGVEFDDNCSYEIVSKNYKFEYDEFLQLDKINNVEISNLLDSEDLFCVGGMCDILKIVDDYIKEKDITDSELINRIKEFIETISVEFIPEYLLKNLT